MSAIDNDKITALLNKGRSRGAGGQEIKEFIASGEAGVEVSLTSGRFAGKTAKQVKTSLDNTKKSSNANGLVFPEGPDLVVRIDKDDSDVEHVYLINPKLL